MLVSVAQPPNPRGRVRLDWAAREPAGSRFKQHALCELELHSLSAADGITTVGTTVVLPVEFSEHNARLLAKDATAAGLERRCA